MLHAFPSRPALCLPIADGTLHPRQASPRGHNNTKRDTGPASLSLFHLDKHPPLPPPPLPPPHAAATSSDQVRKDAAWITYSSWCVTSLI
ncbi:hypothetical protein E2C01_095828 [Portunus trituberculatus]|uniref:Uncharacterized protein n=1 Tax=Portunus trituberculatus TaxID=210409 RepID=A0A5B7JQV7_PORTR|nr:hypothetical protein [Portunus trituberculatus]